MYNYFEKLKPFLILVGIFGIIYWFQIVDDKRRCKERIGIYNKIKLPLLVVSIVGLIIFWYSDNLITNCKINNEPDFIEIIPQVNNNKNLSPSIVQPEFEVYIGLPEW
jgi:hypothetical protein